MLTLKAATMVGTRWPVGVDGSMTQAMLESFTPNESHALRSSPALSWCSPPPGSRLALSKIISHCPFTGGFQKISARELPRAALCLDEALKGTMGGGNGRFKAGVVTVLVWGVQTRLRYSYLSCRFPPVSLLARVITETIFFAHLKRPSESVFTHKGDQHA
jgi:hypothetical protein